jgi:hypothetical protein
MILKKYVLIIIISFINVCYAGSTIINTDKDSIVAMIGNDFKISFKDLGKYVTDWQYNLKYRDKFVGYKIALETMILNQLKRFDFFDRGMDKNDDIMRGIRRTINEELLVQYFDKHFVAKYANEINAAKSYKLMDKEVIGYQIVLPIKRDEKNATLDSLKKKAIEIKNEFNNSEQIGIIIKKYSRKDVYEENPRIVHWEQSIKDPVAKEIFNLQKGATRVIRSIDGFYIVKVKEVRKIKVEPYEKIKNDIIQKLKEGYSETYYNEYNQLKKSQVDEKSLNWNEKGLEKLVEWSNIPNFYMGVYKDTIQKFLNKGNSFEILSYNNGKVDLKEYFRLLDEVLIMNASETITVEKVKSFVLEAIYSDFIVKKARGTDLEKNFFNPYTNNSQLKHRIALIYNKVEIEDKIPRATAEDLRNFYTEQKESFLYQLAKVNIYAHIYSDSLLAAEEMKKINNGIPFEKISNNWYNKAFIRERDGKLNSYLSTEPPYLAEASFKLRLNEVAGPIVYYDKEYGNQYAIIKCSDLRPEKQPTYDEVNNSIKEKFIDFYQQRITESVEKRLKAKYKVEIFQDVLMKQISTVK